GSRILVHESLVEKFTSELAARAKALRVGDPLEAATQQGALSSRAHLEKVSSLVDQARQLGAKLHAGGKRVSSDALPVRCKGGFFFEPTVLSGLDPNCVVEQEEIFGPVVTIQPFKDEAEALALANGTKYGLAATIFSQNVARAHRVAAKVEAGTAFVDCWMGSGAGPPLGGVKGTGVGR